MPQIGSASLSDSPLPPRLDKWEAGIDQAACDPRWQQYDRDILSIVGDYNRHLADTPGYVSLDWEVVKAMLFVETGPIQRDWKTKPMQIGNQGDPGLRTLMTAGSKLPTIVPANLLAHLSSVSAVSNGQMNIVAGVGYLLLRAARWEQGIKIIHKTLGHVTVKPGDTLSSIARAVGSTEALLQKLNPSASPRDLKIGTVLTYQRATSDHVIIGRRSINGSFIMSNYNGLGDRDYARKFDYAFTFLKKHRKLPPWLPPSPS